ncbi:MAG TPA: hypothetical protein VLT82_03650 [Myxococcaceae bacterium]|nr:hypothetical protein [Myxococcaceae bacterium]
MATALPTWTSVLSMSVPAGNYAVFVTLKANVDEAQTGSGIDTVQGLCEITAGAPGSVGFQAVGGPAPMEPPNIQGMGSAVWNRFMVWPAAIQGTVTLATTKDLVVSCAVLVANTATFKVSNIDIIAIKVGTLTQVP